MFCPLLSYVGGRKYLTSLPDGHIYYTNFDLATLLFHRSIVLTSMLYRLDD